MWVFFHLLKRYTLIKITARCHLLLRGYRANQEWFFTCERTILFLA